MIDKIIPNEEENITSSFHCNYDNSSSVISSSMNYNNRNDKNIDDKNIDLKNEYNFQDNDNEKYDDYYENFYKI